MRNKKKAKADNTRQPSFVSRFLEDSSFLRHYLWKYRKYVSIGLLILIIVDILGVLPPLIIKETIDAIAENKPKRYLAYCALSYLAVLLLVALCRYFWRIFLIRTSIFAERDIRQKYTNHLFSLPTSVFNRRKVGDLIALATNDTRAVSMGIGIGIVILSDVFLYFLTIPVAMFWLSPKLTLLAFIPLPIIPLLVIRNQREIHKRFESIQEAFSKLTAMAQENLMGIRLIKAFAGESTQIKLFAQEGLEYVRRYIKYARLETTFWPTLEFIMTLSLVLLLFVGGSSVISKEITVGSLVAFYRYVGLLVWPMAAVGLAITFYQKATASSKRIKEVLNEKTDVPEPKSPILPVDFSNGKTKGVIEFRNLSFKFPDAEKNVLSNINLKIENGSRVAFIGNIGSGKSALLSLLPRIFPVNKGMLFIDGVDVNEWPLKTLRDQIGYVGQNIFLFSESVKDNVAHGAPNMADLLGAVHSSTKIAAIHDEILAFPSSYNTKLGERGINISGGQKQRLTIARAIAKDPPILILDDALSSVDIKTEEKILETLKTRKNRNTELIAAHRLSTIRSADLIIVLDKGSIAQQGSHQSLLKQKEGIYRKFYERQRLKEELEQYVIELETK